MERDKIIIINSDEPTSTGAPKTIKDELEDELLKDPLYELVPKEYIILSSDILSLDPAKLYSTSSVVEILNKYTYLYDAQKGESYINENRVRWWLNEREDDNLIFYLQLKRPSRNWVWDIHAILRAKMVAILRFALNYQQKYIKARATGLIEDAPKISEDNVMSLVQTGALSQVRDVETLKNILLAVLTSVDKRSSALEENYQELYGELAKVREENEQLQELISAAKDELAKNKEESLNLLQEKHSEIMDDLTKENGIIENTKKAIEERVAERFETFKLENRRGVNTLELVELRRKLKLEAQRKWESENGLLKRIMAKDSDKEEYIEDYIAKNLPNNI